MPKLFGVDIKGILDKHVAPGLRPAVLTRYVQGTRDPTDPTAPIPVTTLTYKCFGIWIDYQNRDIDGSLVLIGDRKALLMKIATLPKAEDTITIDGITLVVVRPSGTDPAGATFTLQCRDRGTSAS